MIDSLTALNLPAVAGGRPKANNNRMVENKETNQSGLLFSKGFIKFSAIFLVVIILLMAFLHWRKGDYRIQTDAEKVPVEQNQ